MASPVCVNMSLKMLLTKFTNRGLFGLSRASGQSSRTGRNYHSTPKPDRVVDLRSDALTKPGTEMRKAMSEAEVGLAWNGEDPTMNELESLAAEMFGMENALFVPSVTMGDMIAVMVHCKAREDEIIVGDKSHLHVNRQRGSAQIANVHSATVATLPDGTFDLDQLESEIRHGFPHPRYSRSRLICVENTHNMQGGRVLPLSFLQEVRSLADKYDLKVHMDGARVMNAAVALGVPVKTILQHTDTVSVCLSKGLGSPVGSILAGPSEFMTGAARCRLALGGSMYQTGILAAAGKLSLLKMVSRLEEDHRNAKTFAQALLDCSSDLFSVDVSTVETNIVRFRLGPGLSPAEFCARMSGVQQGEPSALGQAVQVLMYPHFKNTVRAVWHLGISTEDTHWAIKKMQYVAAQIMGERSKTPRFKTAF